jgi:hypothetical protein
MFRAKKRDKIDSGVRAQQIDIADAFAINAGLVGQQCDPFSLQPFQLARKQDFEPGGDRPDKSGLRCGGFGGFWLDWFGRNSGDGKQRNKKGQN